MSDFLSNFDSKKYNNQENDRNQSKKSSETNSKDESREIEVEKISSRRKQFDEEIEIDPKFKRKKRKQLYLILFLVGVLIIVSIVSYYQIRRVSMPDFQNKTISDVQKWAAKNKMTIETEAEYHSDISINNVIKQNEKPNQKITKGSTLGFLVSKGANPEEQISIPEFSKMTQAETEKWLKKEQLENLIVSSEYDEKIPSGTFISEEFTGEGTRENFKRKDSGKLIFSKGKEVYKKDISVPDFSNKTQNDVETWAKKNEIDLEIKKIASNSIINGQVITQSIKEKEKIAKKTKMIVEISAGKGILVPDFSNLTKETAANQGNLQVLIEEEFNEWVSYGQLISQSVATDTELTENDDLRVKVIYSAGKPYIKDLTGENEGDLQKIFFEEFQSKGANIDYTVNYVNSDLAKGTVVSTDTANAFLPLNYTVTINVSLGY